MYSRVKTPQGVFLIEATRQGLFRVRFPGQWSPRRDRVSARVRAASGNYFRSPTRKLGLKLDLSGCTKFERKVYHALLRVPAGQVVSYGELARRAGYPGAARAVGTAMKKNRLPVVIPCHRVVRGDGSLGQYSAGVKWKRYFLKHEGYKMPRRKSARPEAT